MRELTMVGTENPSQRWIKSMIDAHNRSMLGKRRRLSVGSDEVVAESSTLLKISDRVLPRKQDNLLLLAWVNDVLSQPRFNGKISTVKESLSDELTVKAKSVLGEEWKDGNAVKAFMNDLRRHVRGASFDHPWDNGLLSSMAAVVAKGDNWDKLLSFMQSCGMTDYRLAFAFYGMLNGFANLTRDFTDILLNQDAQYLIEVYREFYGELHGVTIRVPEPETTSAKGSVDRDACRTKMENGVETHSSIFDQMLQLFNGLKIATKNGVSKGSLLNALQLAMSELKPNPDPNKLLDLLVKKYANPYGWKKTIKPWKELKKFAKEHAIQAEDPLALPGFGVAEKKTNSSAENSSGAAKESCAVDSLLEGGWIEKCALLIDDAWARKKFEEDMLWFVGNHREVYVATKTGEKKHGCFWGKFPLTVDRIQQHLSKNLQDEHDWVREYSKKIPITKVLELLRVEYEK